MVIESPTFQKVGAGNKTPISDMKELVEEGYEMERIVKAIGLKGWMVNTEYDNWPMIRFFDSWGGIPYKIDIKNKLIWFFKMIGGNK